MVKGTISAGQATSSNHDPPQSLIRQPFGVAETIQVSQFGTHGRPNLSHACQCRAQELGQFVRELHTFTTHEASAAPAAMSLQVAEGDNVIHLLARDSRWAKLKSFKEILEYSLRQAESLSLSIDAEDCDGMTALEISIRTDNLSAMKILIDHGASLELRSAEGESALAIALDVSASVRLIAKLLRCTQQARQCQYSFVDSDHLNTEALHNIDAIVRSSGDENELQDAYYVIEQVFLHIASPETLYKHWGTEFILRTLLENWIQRDLTRSTVSNNKWALDCVRRILQSDPGILKWYLPWRGGERFRTCCDNPLSFTIFHILNEDVISAFLDICKDRLNFFVICALEVCHDRSAGCNKAYLTRLLKRALETFDDSKRDSMDILGWLSRILDSTPHEMKPAFWKTICGSRSVSIHEYTDYGEGTLAESLAYTDDTSRWEMAELILPHDPGFPVSAQTSENEKRIALFFPTAQTDFSYYASEAYLDHLCHWSSEKRQVNGLEFTDHLPISEPCGCHKLIDQEDDAHPLWQHAAQSAVRMQECVVHVVTKDLCNRTSRFAPDKPLSERIKSALRLREQFPKLPALAIEPELLLEALSGTTEGRDNATSEADLYRSQESPAIQGAKSYNRSALLRGDDEVMEIDGPAAENSRL